MKYTAAILTVSDRCSRGIREDVTGPALQKMLTDDGWDVVSLCVVPDEFEIIKAELVRCSYDLDVCLVLTAGGTGLQNSMYYELTSGFQFLTLGSLAIWTPFVMLAAPVIETPVFALLAKRAYTRHECA